MKKTAWQLVMLFVMAGGIWSAPGFLHASVSPFSIQIPAYSSDLSDLDVRDRYNRKVASVSKHNEIAALFSKSLSDLLLKNLTPSKQAIKFVLSQSWNSTFGWLQKAAEKLLVLVVGWLNKSKWVAAFVAGSMSVVRDVATAWRRAPAQTNFHSLIPALLSSTTILR